MIGSRIVPVVFLVAALGAGCGTPTIRFSVTERAGTDVGEIRRVAVAPFDCDAGSIQEAGRAASDLAVARLSQGGVFEVVERSQIERILREQAMQLEGVVNDQTAVRVGNLLGVDAMVYGSVVGDYRETPSQEARKVQVDTGQRQVVTRTGWDGQPYTAEVPVMREEIVYVNWVTVEVSVTLHARLVGVETGRVLASCTEPRNYSQRVEAASRGRLPPGRQIVHDLLTQGVDAFVRQIAPHPAERRRFFPKPKGDTAAQGYEYAKRGQWADALRMFEVTRTEGSDDPTAWNAIGVCQEALQHPDRAREAFQRAFELSADNRYLDNTAGLDRVVARPE